MTLMWIKPNRNKKKGKRRISYAQHILHDIQSLLCVHWIILLLLPNRKQKLYIKHNFTNIGYKFTIISKIVHIILDNIRLRDSKWISDCRTFFNGPLLFPLPPPLPLPYSHFHRCTVIVSSFIIKMKEPTKQKNGMSLVSIIEKVIWESIGKYLIPSVEFLSFVLILNCWIGWNEV